MNERKKQRVTHKDECLFTFESFSKARVVLVLGFSTAEEKTDVSEPSWCQGQTLI